MKKKFLFVCALLAVLTVSGCKDKKENLKTTLTTPNQIDIVLDDGKSFIVFDEVSGAEYYNISINGNIVTVRSNGMGQIQFDATKLIGEPKDYVIKVNAGGKDYFDSEYTEEYVYSVGKTIDAPVVSKDGTILNWAKVAGADMYEVFAITPVSTQSFKCTNNSFNFEKMITIHGEYSFYVVAISQDGQTIESLKSNDITYIHTENLKTPHNLKIDYDSDSKEEVLTFVSSEDVEEFEIDINNHIYSSEEDVNNSTYWKQGNFKNVYMFRIGAFARDNQIDIKSGTLLNVKIKAISNSYYLNSSQFSENVEYQVKLALAQPEIITSITGDMCNITINAVDNGYLSQIAIYFDDKKYQNVDASFKNLQIPLSVINDASIRVQSISNNNNCFDSNLSVGKYANGTTVDSMALNQDGTVISWDSVTGASKYLIEISNEEYRKTIVNDSNTTSCDISLDCKPGSYSVRVIVFGQESYESNRVNVTISNKLNAPTNLEFKDNGRLYFTPAERADGYMVVIKQKSPDSQQYIEKTIPYLFVSSPIDISSYMIEAQDYIFSLQSIDLLNNDNNSELAEEINYKNVKTLTAPKLQIDQEGDEFYLKITPKAEETALITKYEVWIDYVNFDALIPDENGRINVTSYLQNAGLHNFMVKALATDNEFLRDSSMSSISQTIYKQLDKVENIEVNHPSESKYTISFDGPVMAGRYNIKIIKADDPSFDIEISSPSGFVDISEYVRDSGGYRIYIQAIANQADGYYRSSEITSYIFTKKGETLIPVTNIAINKDQNKDEINLSWDMVNNAEYYRVQVYYVVNNTRVLNKDMIVSQSSTPKVNIVSGENIAIDKEGAYIIEIKAVGNEVYESSSIATTTHNHTMETVGDFERNKVFVEGDIYSYKVSDANDLKHLLWQHYLYNNRTWAYDTINYNLKIYCDLDLLELASQVGGIDSAVNEASNNIEKMDIIATELLNQYKEALVYNANYNSSICVEEKDNIYIFSYQKQIPQIEPTTTSNSVYVNDNKGEKINVVDEFNKRLSSYKFAIDSQESIDVTTTEQLFMALQYNKQPNFVGDSAVAEAVYENARYILRQICSDQMTDYEKVLNIYDFLTKRIAWNYEAEAKLNRVNNNSNLKELYLESVLYNNANSKGLFTTIGDENYSNNLQISNLNEFIGTSSISQGVSKVFVVLCSIEGIDSIKVNGTLNDKDYSWNKVYIDMKDDQSDEKQWYAIDIGSAIKNKMQIGGVEYQVNTHRYFLVKDSQITAIEYNNHKRLGDISYQATTDFDYYSYQEYQCEFNDIEYAGNMVVSGGDGIKNLIKYAMINANSKTVIIDIDAKGYIDTFGGQLNESTIKSNINALYGTAMQDIGLVYSMSFKIVDSRYIIFAFEPFV